MEVNRSKVNLDPDIENVISEEQKDIQLSGEPSNQLNAGNEPKDNQSPKKMEILVERASGGKLYLPVKIKFLTERRNHEPSTTIPEKPTTFIPPIESIEEKEDTEALIETRRVLRELDEDSEKRKHRRDESRRQLGVFNDRLSTAGNQEQNSDSSCDLSFSDLSSDDEFTNENADPVSRPSVVAEGAPIPDAINVEQNILGQSAPAPVLEHAENAIPVNNQEPIAADVALAEPKPSAFVRINQQKRIFSTPLQNHSNKEDAVARQPLQNIKVIRKPIFDTHTVPDRDQETIYLIGDEVPTVVSPVPVVAAVTSKRRNALSDITPIIPLYRTDVEPEASRDFYIENPGPPEGRDRKRRNALLVTPSDASGSSGYKSNMDYSSRNFDDYSDHIPQSVIDESIRASKRKRSEDYQSDTCSDFDLFKNDPAALQQQVLELEYYQGLKEDQEEIMEMQGGLNYAFDTVGPSTSKSIKEFNFNNPKLPTWENRSSKSETSDELPTVLPLELVGQKMKTPNLKSELMELVDKKPSDSSSFTDCSTGSSAPIKAPKHPLTDLDKEIMQHNILLDALITPDAPVNKPASDASISPSADIFTTNFSTNSENIATNNVKGEQAADPTTDTAMKPRPLPPLVQSFIDDIENDKERLSKLTETTDSDSLSSSSENSFEFSLLEAKPVPKPIPWYDIEAYLEASPTSYKNMRKAGFKIDDKYFEEPPKRKPQKMKFALRKELFGELITLLQYQKANGIPFTPIPGLLSDDSDSEEEGETKKTDVPAPASPTETTTSTETEASPEKEDIKVDVEKTEITEQKQDDTNLLPKSAFVPMEVAPETKMDVAPPALLFEEFQEHIIRKQLAGENTDDLFSLHDPALTFSLRDALNTPLIRPLDCDDCPSIDPAKVASIFKLPDDVEKPPLVRRSTSLKKSRADLEPYRFAVPVCRKRENCSIYEPYEIRALFKMDEPARKKRPPPIVQKILTNVTAYPTFHSLPRENVSCNTSNGDVVGDRKIEDKMPEQKLPPLVLRLKTSQNSRKRLESSRDSDDEITSFSREDREEIIRIARQEMTLIEQEGSNNSDYCRNANRVQSVESFKERKSMAAMHLEKRQKLSHDEPVLKTSDNISERAAVSLDGIRQQMSGLDEPDNITQIAPQPPKAEVFDVAKTLKALKIYKKFVKLDSQKEQGKNASRFDSQLKYIEESGKFRVKKQARYELGKRSVDNTKSTWSHEQLVETLQKYFTYISFLIQGVLTGLLLGDTVYTFSFENEKALPKDQALALPLNAVMCAGCTVACIAVMDILSNMKATVENQAKREKLIVALALWIVALTTSALSISSDEILSPINDNALDEEGLVFRKLYCLTRSLSALGAWVFITYGMEMKRPKNEIGVNADVSQDVADELD